MKTRCADLMVVFQKSLKSEMDLKQGHDKMNSRLQSEFRLNNLQKLALPFPRGPYPIPQLK